MSLQAAVNETIAPLAGSLPAHCQSDVQTLRRFVHATVSADPPAAAISADKFRDVLLTGATGFIGRFFLSELLRQRADLRVHCVVRADSVAHGHERIRAALQQAEVWDDSFGPRIEVAIGDIGHTRFGLTTGHFDGLCGQIDAVYHLAADINLLSSYLGIRRINTFGVRNVLELCLRKRFKHLFYASTMGVFPQYFCGFANEFEDARIDHQMQPDLARMKETFPIGLLGYPWSKLTSEQALRFAQQTGMPLAILRLPQTNLSSTGYSPVNDLAVRMFAAAAECEALPEGFTFRSSNEAVDTLSRICAAISLNANRRFTIYHCCNPELDEYDLEPGDFGFYWPQVPYDSFKRACQARGESSPLHGYWTVLDHFARYWFSRKKPQDRLPICDRAIREDCPLPIEWTGTLTKLRRSHLWVERHRREWPYAVPQSRLDFDSLMARAKRYAAELGVSFDAAYPDWKRQALRQLVGALKAPEARLEEDKLGNVVFELSRFLRHNALFAKEAQRHPEIGKERIARPVFIVGINRSGTTLMHRLMVRDKRFWALRMYELVQPILSTGDYVAVAGTPMDPRRVRTEEAYRAFDIFKALEGVHPFGIDEPEEDFPIFKTAFSSWTFAAQFHVPGYKRWLAANGLGDAYAFHYRAAQHYTWQRLQAGPGHRGQWLFKMPFHLMELETLIETYPDALFIQTHRTPAEVMGSWNSLVERARSVAMEPLSGDKTGAEQLAFMSEMLNGATRFRSAHPELEHRWVDVAYVDLIRDPMKVVRDIYSRFGWLLEQTAVNEMEDWLSWQEDLRRREKRHSYMLQDFGLTAGQVNAAFAPYLDFAAARGIHTEPPVRR
ncbi:MAG: NAD-dependent epimerase/dehydratase family protein [Acidobacteriia bacterium]|nr:NAD-dependent epimerase/dehydratase family protein [Terriglobia bacterium]